MKVLLTHEHFAPDFAGGGEYVVLEIARHLIRRGMGVEVLTTGDPSVTGFEGIRTFRLPIHRYRLNFAAREIARRAQGTDLIQTFSYHAALPSLVAGKWLGKPVVCMIMGLYNRVWREMRGPLLGRFFMAWERFLLKQDFSRFIFLSSYSRIMGIEMGVSPSRSIVNSPGIEVDKYGPSPEKDDVVLFVGKLEVRKGIYDFLEVARALPDIFFRVMGWGTEEGLVRKIAPSNVEFVKFVRGQKLREAFGRAKIFFFPSKSETFGLVLVEAMAAGCAIVSTIPLGFEGAVVRAGNREAMIQAISRLSADPEETSRIGRRNMELAKAYTWDRHTDLLLDIYAKVLQDSGR